MIDPRGGLTLKKWTTIARVLPPEIDAVALRASLEVLSREKRSARAIADDLGNKIKKAENVLCSAQDHFGSDCPDEFRNQFIGSVQTEIARLRDEQAHYCKLASSGNHRAAETDLKKFGILRSWQLVGGQMGVSTPKEGPERGAVIDYYRAACLALFGKEPAPYAAKKIISLYKKRHLAPRRWGGDGRLSAGLELIDLAKNLVTDR